MFSNDLLESRSSWRRKCENRDPRADECRGRQVGTHVRKVWMCPAEITVSTRDKSLPSVHYPSLPHWSISEMGLISHTKTVVPQRV